MCLDRRSFVVPRSAVRVGSQVLVVDQESRLRFRDIEVVRTDRDRAVVRQGLEPKDRVCISQIETVVDGMPVRTLLEDAIVLTDSEEEERL